MKNISHEEMVEYFELDSYDPSIDSSPEELEKLRQESDPSPKPIGAIGEPFDYIEMSNWLFHANPIAGNLLDKLIPEDSNNNSCVYIDLKSEEFVTEDIKIFFLNELGTNEFYLRLCW